MSSTEPATIGHFRVIAPLGQGGMGVVYRAEHLETGRIAAVKTVLLTSKDSLQSIRREIQALARLHHPGLVRFLDEGMEGGRPWYAMELLQGVPLRTYLARFEASHVEAQDTPPDVASAETLTRAAIQVDPRTATAEMVPTLPRLAPARIPVDRSTIAAVALRLARRLCAPLAFLHGEGVVHRDLKPENILVTAGEQPVIIDFGLAIQYEGKLSLDFQQATSQAEGTLLYIAPEMLAGKPVDARADLYALGCMLYEMLAGRPPFDGPAVSIIRGHLLGQPEPLDSIVSGLPESVCRLVERLLAKNPRDRIGYADDVAAIIPAWCDDGVPVAEAPAPRAYIYRPGLVGRDDALQVLLHELGGLTDGRSALVLVGGESGVGKTRLIVEVARVADARHVRVLLGECSDQAGTPLEALRRPLQAIADQLRSRDEPAVERILGARGKVLAAHVPELAELPGQAGHPEPPRRRC